VRWIRAACAVNHCGPYLPGPVENNNATVGYLGCRQDEAGTSFCVTVDGQTLQDQPVIVRERDSMHQVRVSTSQLLGYLRDKLDL